MEILLETERLILRELQYTDQDDLFEMDSDPEVHLYIENNPVKSMAEIHKVISIIRNQYKDNGIARWAVVDKATLECLGWAGLKYIRESINNHNHFYELGYRFKRKHWGKGYATESSKAILDYGFKHFPIDAIYAITDPKNLNSKRVLGKLGFEFKETCDHEDDLLDWYELTRAKWADVKPGH